MQNLIFFFFKKQCRFIAHIRVIQEEWGNLMILVVNDIAHWQTNGAQTKPAETMPGLQTQISRTHSNLLYNYENMSIPHSS